MSGESDKGDVVGRVPPRGERANVKNAASGDAAYNQTRPGHVGRVPPRGVPNQNELHPRRLRRLHRVWPDRDGNISYLLTICVDGRAHVLNNEVAFERFVAFLLESPPRYHWFGRRFVVMPDHIHLIAHMRHDAVRLGQWIKALKAVIGGLEHREDRPVGTPGLQDDVPVGRVPSHGAPMPSHGDRENVKDAASGDAAYKNLRPDVVGRVPPRGVPAPSHGVHEFTRAKRSWRWQDGFHDHKFRTPESESRKWEYVCLNPVRYGLVQRPEAWPFGGEIFYDEAGGPRLVRCTPPLLETGILMMEEAPREGTRPTT